MPALWRVFPWDPGARAGAPFSPQYLPEQSGLGRFDLPLAADASAWYFAETPEHAVAEKIQDLRNRELRDEFLFERGHRLAIARVEASPTVRLADLCDPLELATRGVAPDRMAYRDRLTTQDIAAKLYSDTGLAGFHWWSAFFGEWHTVILFSDRLPRDALSFKTPEHLRTSTEPVLAAAAAFAIELARA